MSSINKAIPRGLQVIFIIAILAVLVWKFATNTDYLYFAIGGAFLVAIVLTVAIYTAKPATGDDYSGRKKVKEFSGADTGPTGEIAGTGDLVMEAAEAGPSAVDRGFRSVTEKPDAHEVALYYFRMAAIAKAREEEENTWHPRPKTIEDEISDMVANRPPTEPVETDAVGSDTPAAENVRDISGEARVEAAPNGGKGGGASEGEKASETPGEKMPLVIDQTSLTEEEKSALENAVWYRCENPYCKYTHFLDVHHIVEEKDGGTNKLDNLIVLCPFCHGLAHKNEIPEEEMRDWITNREVRFKDKLQWKYF